MAAIAFEHIEKRYGPITAVAGLSFDVADGEHLVLVGPSGCGKTTVLRLLAGLETPTAGRILFDGQPAPAKPQDRDVAMVFQEDALYPHMNVLENIAFSLRMRKVPRPAILQRVAEAAKRLGIERLLERRPRELSGGERRRVALARALARRPACWLLDEPLANLDAGLRGEIRRLLKRRQHDLRLTTLHVTHDQEEAMAVGDRIGVLREGRLEQLGAPLEIYNAPANRFVAGFLGWPPMNFIEGRCVSGQNGACFEAGTLRMNIPAGLPIRAGEAIVLGLRPERLAVRSDCPESVAIAGPVTLVEPLGDRTDVQIAPQGLPPLTARLPAADAPPIDSQASFHFDPRAAFFFEPGPLGKRLMT